MTAERATRPHGTARSVTTMVGYAPRCGTAAGYQDHIYRREVTCQPCCDAHATAMAEWRAGSSRDSGPVDDLLYRAALAGREPAEALSTADRRRFVAVLHRRGWTDVEISTHTRMTTYTAARIRAELGLMANPASVT